MGAGVKVTLSISLNSEADAALLESLTGVPERRQSATIREYWRRGLRIDGAPAVLRAVDDLRAEVRDGFGRLEHLLVQLPTGQIAAVKVEQILQEDDPRTREIKARLRNLGARQVATEAPQSAQSSPQVTKEMIG